jgi:FMN phosphatase YigB (HAD superfamily)
MIEQFHAILLDMNDTFMFGADRFDENQNYAEIYQQLGGTIAADRVNHLIRSVYDYLDVRYPDPQYREAFPSLREAFVNIAADLSEQDLDLLVETFAYHELGEVPPEYAAAIQRLSQRFRLALVIDIWAPKTLWIKALSDCGVLQLCEAVSFSSDHGMVKPSPKPFWQVLAAMQVDRQNAIVIGDSVRRDLGGAIAAGIDCILVGGAKHPSAFGTVNSLLDLG